MIDHLLYLQDRSLIRSCRWSMNVHEQPDLGLVPPRPASGLVTAARKAAGDRASLIAHAKNLFE